MTPLSVPPGQQPPVESGCGGRLFAGYLASVGLKKGSFDSLMKEFK